MRRVFALGSFVGLALLAPASAAAAPEHPFLGTFGSANEPSFAEPLSMAVDQSTGDVLVIDGEANTVSRWREDGAEAEFSALGTNVIDGAAGGADETPQGGLSFGSAGEVQIAIDNSGGPNDGNIYVPQASAPHVVDIFSSGGEFLGQLTESSEGPFSEPCGVAVDPTGNVYVGDFGFSTGQIHKYEPSANPPVNGDNTANFPFEKSCTLAAGAGPTNGSIFPVELFSGEVQKLNSDTGEQEYVVDQGPTKTVSVDPTSGDVYTASDNEVKEFDASGGSEATPLPSFASGEAQVTGIAISESSGNVYVSRAGTSNLEVWGPAVAFPEAVTESATVLSGVVTLHGVVSAAGGPPATCAFQYVEVDPQLEADDFTGSASAPCSPEGPFAGEAKQAVSAELLNLSEAVYKFRLVASSEVGANPGTPFFFNTFVDPPLPDSRAYEMVSPPQKVGEVIPSEPTGSLGSTCEDCMPGKTYAEQLPSQTSPEGESVVYSGQPFSSGLASDLNQYLASRTAAGWETQSLSSPATTGRFQGFSPDLSHAVLAQTEPVLSPAAPTRGSEAFENLYLRQTSGLQPIITAEPPDRDAAPFTQHSNSFQILYSGANGGTGMVSPFEHLIFEANDALTPAAPEVSEIEAGEECTFSGSNCNLYEWNSGELRLINVLPDNATAASHVMIGAGRLLADINLQFQSPNVEHAISSDGSRIFWSSEESGQVYVRVGGVETLEIPGPGTCKKSVPLTVRACFLTASADGSMVLLSDGQLYELNEAGSAYLPTVDLTESKGGFEGVLGGAEDLSRIYFVDTAVLEAENDENENGERPEEKAGHVSLYAWLDGQLRFIGNLLGEDNTFGTQSRYGTWKAAPPNRTAQVTRDGRHVAFMSSAELTGYRNEENLEVFEYSAESGRLACVSCNPTGQPPLGPSNLTLTKPGSPGSNFPPFRQPGNLSSSGSGRLFFESQDVLTAHDTNGHIQDVYEWEPNGVGSCERAKGCVHLISSGHAANDSYFVDSTLSGDDAFFITRERLVPRDKDSLLDLYDARAPHVLGEVVGFPESGSSPCAGETCAGPISSLPPQLTRGSENFSGPGNPPRPKQKKKHRKHHHHRKHHKQSAPHHRGGAK